MDNSKALTRAIRNSFTYAQVGATELMLDGGSVPEGFRLAAAELPLELDSEQFRQFGEGIINWKIQTLSGLRVEATGPAEPEATVVSFTGVGPLRFPVPCRVIWTSRTESRIGFGYGTLPGHPVSGEEAFVIERTERGIQFRVVAFSKPAWLPFKIAPFVAKLAQESATNGYLKAARRLAQECRN